MDPLAPRLLHSHLAAAVRAARAAGALMRANHHATKRVHSASAHDIKLELDVRCQKRIERLLLQACPDFPILGEEGSRQRPNPSARWVVDPIDGTVNFAYGIPHCCTSIALQFRTPPSASFQTVVGVVYDPFCNELWTAVRGRRAQLNGRPIRVSNRSRLGDCLVSVGFAKSRASLQRTLPALKNIIPRVRKIRIMGAAALGLVYVACGRLDAYIEYGLRLWDVAAGGLILECAGGDFWNRPLGAPYSHHIVASNGRLNRALAAYKRID